MSSTSTMAATTHTHTQPPFFALTPLQPFRIFAFQSPFQTCQISPSNPNYSGAQLPFLITNSASPIYCMSNRTFSNGYLTVIMRDSPFLGLTGPRPEQRPKPSSKVDPRSTYGCFIGYSDTTTMHKVWDFERKC